MKCNIIGKLQKIKNKTQYLNVNFILYSNKGAEHDRKGLGVKQLLIKNLD